MSLKLPFLATLLIILSSVSFGSWGYYENHLANICSIIIIVVLLVDYLIHINERSSMGKQLFRKEVFLLLMLPFVSCFSCLIYRNQPLWISIVTTRSVLLWLFYFFLHRMRFSIKEVESLILMVGTYIAILYIAQQLLYPGITWFGCDTNENGEIQRRNGLWRFYISGFLYMIFACFILVDRISRKYEIKRLLYILFLLVAIYLTLTRQLIVATLVSLFVVPFLSKKKTNIKIAIFVTCVFFVILGSLFWDVLFSRFVETAQIDAGNNTYVRYATWKFFGLDYWVDWINVLFGNGREAIGKSDYGNYILMLKEQFGLYRSDIGIVGVFSMYGAVYVLVVFALYLKLFRYLPYCPLYVSLVVFASLMTIVMVCWVGHILFGLLFYLTDLHVSKAKYQQLYGKSYIADNNGSDLRISTIRKLKEIIKPCH